MIRAQRRACAALLSILLFPAIAGAEEWIAVGGEARGMGGTGVALDRSPYWNPAVIHEFRKDDGKDAKRITNFLSELDFAVLFGLEVSAQGDVIAEADDVIDLVDEKDFDLVQDRLNNGTATATDIEYALVLIKEINDLNRRGEGIYASSGTNAYLRLGKNIGIVAGAYAWSGADPNFDLDLFSALSSGGFATLFAVTGTGMTPLTGSGGTLSSELQTAGVPVDEANQLAWFSEQAGLDLNNPDVREGIVLAAQNTSSSPNPAETLYNNKSGFTLSGIIIQEIGLSLSLPILSGKLSIGGSVKLLQGITYRRDYVIKDIDTGKALLEDTYQDFQSNREVSNKLGIDLGIVARPIPQIAMGVTAKNLTRPTFRMAGDGSYMVKPHVRAGIAALPLKSLSFALDFDLTMNESQALEGFHSQILAFGAEFKPVDSTLFGFALRTGIYQD
ncbi:MAG: conjugal transfer protein TraF, partial [Planctomycetota bacterium]